MLAILGEFSIWRRCGWWLQTEVFGTQGKTELQVYHFQTGWDHAKCGGGEGWQPSWDSPRPQQQLACWWLSLCCLWLWLHYWWELPQEQDFLHCLVCDDDIYFYFTWFLHLHLHSSSFLWFNFRSPETSKVKNKMLYASSKDRFKRELDGIQVELQATDASEMSMDIFKERAYWNWCSLFCWNIAALLVIQDFNFFFFDSIIVGILLCQLGLILAFSLMFWIHNLRYIFWRCFFN